MDERSNKTMTGVMLAYGSWDAYGNEAQGLGEKKMQVRVYGPSGKKDETTYKLMKAHVDDLTRTEEKLVPRMRRRARRDHGRARPVSSAPDERSVQGAVEYRVQQLRDGSTR